MKIFNFRNNSKNPPIVNAPIHNTPKIEKSALEIKETKKSTIRILAEYLKIKKQRVDELGLIIKKKDDKIHAVYHKWQKEKNAILLLHKTELEKLHAQQDELNKFYKKKIEELNIQLIAGRTHVYPPKSESLEVLNLKAQIKQLETRLAKSAPINTNNIKTKN